MKVRSALLFALGLVLFLLPRTALADAKTETAATSLQKKAMDDYIATDFTKAQSKLEKAIGQCGDAKCGPGLRSRLLRDLGVIQIGGAIDKEKGIGNFVAALKIDPGVNLDPDIKTKDLEAAFAEAKKRAGGGGGAEETPKPKKKPVAAASDGSQPEGDFVHTPTEQQQIRTAIPVYAEYNGETVLVRVIARYKGFGMAEWKNVELKKMGDKGWGGIIPCGDVQQGYTQYFLTGFDGNNDPVATGGDRNNPYKVQVTNDKPGEAPHLPGQPAPNQCQDTGDCPPGFPGCKKKPAGAAVEGETKSEPTGKEGGEFCEEDAECKSGSCSASKCTDYEGGSSSDAKGRRFWVGLMGSLDYNFVPSVEDACKLTNTAFPVNSSNYYCVNSSGADYPSRDPKTGKAANDAIVTSANRGSDKVAGGGALGNIRIMLSADYALTGNMMLGARLGVVVNTYPGEAAGQDGKRFSAPIHAELRFTYVVGKDAIFKKGLAPYFFAGGGVAPFETRVGVQTIELPAGSTTPTKKSVDAWHIAGPGFLGIGGGLRYAITPRFALLGAIRADFAFLNAFVPSLGPEIGGQVGF